MFQDQSNGEKEILRRSLKRKFQPSSRLSYEKEIFLLFFAREVWISTIFEKERIL